MLCEKTAKIVVEETQNSRSPAGRTLLMVKQEKCENVSTM
jgi:hypothetical protein